MLQRNCVFRGSLATRFPAAPELINEAYKGTPYGSENWVYPYLIYGEPCSNFYSEVWTTGMDWTLDVWVIHVGKSHEPQAELIIHFSDNNKMINDHDLKDILRGILSRFSGFGAWGYDIFKFIKTFPSEGPQEADAGYGRFYFRHASQDVVDFWMNMKFYRVIKDIVE